MSPPSFPHPWPVRRLGDIASFRKGQGLSKSSLSVGGRRPCIHYGELFSDYKERIDVVIHGTSDTGPFVTADTGDVLMPTSDVTPSGLATASCLHVDDVVIGSDVLIVKPLGGLVNGLFLAYLIRNNRDQVLRRVYGTTVSHLRAEDMAAFTARIPDLREQAAIVALLSDMDDQIQALEALVAKKRAIREAARWRLISGDMRLPGLADAWSLRKLGDIALFRKGYGLSKSSLTVGGQRACVHYGELITHYREQIDVVIHGTSDPGTFVVAGTGDVLMPTSAETPEGLVTASCLQIDDIVIGGDILVIRPIDGTINGLFLAHLIKNNRDQVMRRVYGTAVSHLRTEDMATFAAAVPSLREQAAIVALLSDMDAGIAALERRLDKTRAIGLGMKQQLLTGRLRVSGSGRSSDNSAAFVSVENAHTDTGDLVGELPRTRRTLEPL